VPIPIREEKRPWYRERLVWMLIALPGSAVIAGIVTIWLAVTTSDGLVADDYYKQGLAINQTMARDELARRLGLEAEIDIRLGQVRVLLSGRDEPPEALVMTLIHPTRAGQDQIIHLRKQRDGYAGDFADPIAGRWSIRLEDEALRWRMNGSAYLPASEAFRIGAG